MAFLVNSTPIQQVIACADVGERMPRKTTFFFPKLGTGVVMLPMDRVTLPLPTGIPAYGSSSSLGRHDLGGGHGMSAGWKPAASLEVGRASGIT